MDFYYKNKVVYFQYRGVRIPAQIKFPESITQDKKYTFNYNDNTDVTISFQLSMETYYPSFNEETNSLVVISKSSITVDSFKSLA